MIVNKETLNDLIMSVIKPYIFFQNSEDFLCLEDFIIKKMKKSEAFILNGKNMKDWGGFSDELTKKFRFPDYHGDNWDAFDEMLTDLSWIEFEKIVILIKKFDEVGVRQRAIAETVLKVLESAGASWSEKIDEGEWWDRPAIPFHVFLESSRDLSVAGAAPLHLRDIQ